MLLLAGAVFAACGDKEEKKPDNGEGNYPPVTITGQVSGPKEAGVAGAIEITGTGFDPEMDYVYIGYTVSGGERFDRVSPEVLTIRAGRITFGVNVTAVYIDKTVKIYLDRPDYDRMPISGDITFTLPDVSEGYIPDAGFRATLMSTNPDEGNPTIASMFDSYGMLDVAKAATVTDINLYACKAVSIEGIELFTGATIVRGWDMPNVREIDLSKWTAKGVAFHCERALSLEKLIGAPWCRTIICDNCPKLTHVDVHDCNWLTRLQISGPTADAAPSAVTYLDMRRNHSGTWKESPQNEDEFQIWGGDSFLKVAQGATVRIDSWFLKDHNVANNGIPSCWANIYGSWKDRGATIEVYSRVDPHRDELLGTAPSYATQADALSPNNKDGAGDSANKWKVTDTYAGDQ